MKHTDDTHDCPMRESLVAYLYNEATPEESRIINSHLSECAACKQEMAVFERVRGMLQQWQLDDLPVVRVETSPARKRSALESLKDLLAVMPVWAKLLGAMATVMIVLAVLGTEVSIDGSGFRMRTDILRAAGSAPVVQEASETDVEQLRAEMKTFVSTLIAESERQQKEQLKAQLVSFETELQTMQAADLARLAEAVQRQRARLSVIERDIDRREGYDLTDILFSELNGVSGERSRGSD
ncbi:MAG TPA: zf-HC2 domain-containing protein [Blastocatellia bacterium]|nr:zf-HC2 domain-containing protein [Blastocatellia bacterium]